MSLIKFIRPTTLRYIGREHQSGNIYTFSFKPTSALSWHAGQHGLIELRLSSGKSARRMFSLSSAPSEKIVSITTYWIGDDKASDFKKALWQMKPGVEARVRGPVGPLYVRDPSQQNVFIAGGIGITPFSSILQEAVNQKQDLHGVLFHLNRVDSRPIFKTELLAVAKQLPHLQVNFLTVPEDIPTNTLQQISNNNSHAMFYIAGPPKLIRHYSRLLKDVGVPSSHIKSDLFRGFK